MNELGIQDDERRVVALTNVEIGMVELGFITLALDQFMGAETRRGESADPTLLAAQKRWDKMYRDFHSLRQQSERIALPSNGAEF